MQWRCCSGYEKSVKIGIEGDRVRERVEEKVCEKERKIR